jgi:predicted dehydrogenase
VPGSQCQDATLAGVVAQAQAFARRVGGESLGVPNAETSARSTQVGHAVIESAATGREVSVQS